MDTPQDTRSQTLQVRLRPSEYQTLSELAAREDEPVSAVVRRAIRRYVEQAEAPAPPRLRNLHDKAARPRKKGA